MDGMIEELKDTLGSFSKPVICFSGGLDSTVLLRNAMGYCDDPVALFVRLPMNTSRQIDSAERIAEYLGIGIRIEDIRWDELSGMENNPQDRCYICKSAIYRKAKEIASSCGADAVLAGDNADDKDSDRPGHRAAFENGIRNPLKEAGIGKSAVISAIEEMGLPVPMFKDTCMATRYPFNYPIGEKEFRFAEECESAVRKISGLEQLRIRIDGNRALVQTDEKELPNMIRFRTQITYELKSRGLDCDLDLNAYKGV